MDRIKSLVRQFVLLNKLRGSVTCFPKLFRSSLKSLKDHKPAYRINDNVIPEHKAYIFESNSVGCYFTHDAFINA